MNIFGLKQRRARTRADTAALSHVSESPSKRGSPVSHRMRQCCGALNSIVGSIVSTSRHHPTEEHHHQQHEPPVSQSDGQVVGVVEMERELEKQKEMRMMYKKRMEKTQDYLKLCLQAAQDTGCLHLILKTPSTVSAPSQPLCLPSPNSVCSNFTEGATQTQTPSEQHHSDLSLVIQQAKFEGWFIDPEEIVLEEEVARGTTAEIYRATWRGSEVAVKQLFPDFFRSNPNGSAFFAQEIETLSRQRHRFVLRLMGACIDPPDRAWIVTEFLESTLKEWLHGSGSRQVERSIPLPPLAERVRVAVEIAQAVQYLHGQKPMVIHRDLKPSNVFLDDGMHVRVADFGHARFLRDEEMALTGETGTYVYMAPEVIRCEPYDEKCDVYSFAIILNELITGNHPYIETGFGPSKIAFQVAEGQLRPTLAEDDEERSKDLIRLITVCWDQDPSMRPPFSTITRDLRRFQQSLAQSPWLDNALASGGGCDS